MALMPWNDALVLGIASIDEQHQTLVKHINAMDAELNRPAADLKTLSHHLEDLVDAMMNHFIAEEELFKRHGHPQADAHTHAHSGETEKLVQLLDQVHADATALGQDMLAQLKDWLTRHIQVDDKAGIPLLQSKGAA